MKAVAVESVNEPNKLCDAKGAVAEILAGEGAGDLVGGIAAAGEDEDTAGSEGSAEFLQDGFLLMEGQMKGAVPGGDEGVFFWQCPLADIGVWKVAAGLRCWARKVISGEMSTPSA